jgi:hypothetical protein
MSDDLRRRFQLASERSNTTRQSPPGGTPNRPPENKRCGCGAAIEFGPWHLSDCDRWRRAASRSEHGDPAAQEEEDRHLPDCPDALTKLPKACECPLPAAAGAAQSPQVGAAELSFRECVLRLWQLESCAGMADALAKRLRELRENVPAYLPAKPGRSVSGRPPASESPGPLAALQGAVRRLLPYVESSIELLADEAEPDEIEDARDAVTAARAALRESSAERGGEEHANEKQ